MVTVDIGEYDQSDLTGFLGWESPAEYGDQTFIGTSIWMIFFFLQEMAGPLVQLRRRQLFNF